jgi:DNA-binding protein H-NS
MSKTNPTDILKQFAKLQKHVLTAKKTIEKKIAKDVAAVHKRYAKELKQLEGVLSGFGSHAKAPKAAKATSTGKRSRRSLPKVTDEQIKAAISKIASGGKKVTSAAIFTAAEITRPRFTQFLNANNGFLSIEGNKRSTVYFLKG